MNIPYAAKLFTETMLQLSQFAVHKKGAITKQKNKIPINFLLEIFCAEFAKLKLSSFNIMEIFINFLVPPKSCIWYGSE